MSMGGFRTATLVVGNEILMGKTKDTNTLFLIQRLLDRGLRLSKWMIVPDNVEDISASIRRMVDDGFDMIVVSGGMGPTHDDITVSSISHGLGIPLTEDDETHRRMIDKWKRFFPGREMPPDSNRPMQKMSMIPDGSRPLHNAGGMAEGIHIRIRETNIVIVPGVPREYHSVIGGEEFLGLLPDGDPNDQKIREIRFKGGESQISDSLERYQKENPSIDIGSYPQGPRHVIIRMTGRKDIVDRIYNIVARKVSELERFNEMEGN